MYVPFYSFSYNNPRILLFTLLHSSFFIRAYNINRKNKKNLKKDEENIKKHSDNPSDIFSWTTHDVTLMLKNL